MDDQNVNYRSLQLNETASGGRRNSEWLPSAEALEAKRLQKMYNTFRRQASGASGDSPQSQRLENWFEELEARRREQQKYDLKITIIIFCIDVCVVISWHKSKYFIRHQKILYQLTVERVYKKF